MFVVEESDAYYKLKFESPFGDKVTFSKILLIDQIWNTGAIKFRLNLGTGVEKIRGKNTDNFI